MFQKTKKTQVNQKQLLTEFVISNFNELYDVNTGKDIRKPILSIEETKDIRAERFHKWNRITKKLNAIGPPKNLLQWKKCYSDIARHIRSKNNNLNSFRLANPNCEIPAHLQLTENEIKVLALHGNPLKTHRKYYDSEEMGLYKDPFNETQDSYNDKTNDETNLDDEDGNDDNDVHSKGKFVTAFEVVEDTSNDIEPDFEGFPSTSEEKETAVINMKISKKQKLSWKDKANESIELQQNALKNLIDIKKELKNTKSCESCCKSNKLIISMQKDNLNIQKQILEEQRKSNILQAKNLEIQLKLLNELKVNKSN